LWLRIGGSGGGHGWRCRGLNLLDLPWQEALAQNVPWVGGLPSTCFLTTTRCPIVPSVVQRALNPIIFKRRSQLFFKVSTEAANSFIVREGLKPGKTLELHQDFGTDRSCYRES